MPRRIALHLRELSAGARTSTSSSQRIDQISHTYRKHGAFARKSRQCDTKILTPQAGTRSNRRQEAEEEVVQGQGYDHLPRAAPIETARTNNLHHTVKDKANHAVILDKATGEKLQKDVQSYRLITVAVLVDRLKINGSLARSALNDLEEKGVIRRVVSHSSGNIYTRAVGGGD